MAQAAEISSNALQIALSPGLALGCKLRLNLQNEKADLVVTLVTEIPHKQRKLQVRQATAERGRRTAFHKGGKAGAEKPKRKMPEPNVVPGIPLSRLMAGR